MGQLLLIIPLLKEGFVIFYLPFLTRRGRCLTG
jgi:hypothetical protein